MASRLRKRPVKKPIIEISSDSEDESSARKKSKTNDDVEYTVNGKHSDKQRWVTKKVNDVGHQKNTTTTNDEETLNPLNDCIESINSEKDDHHQQREQSSVSYPSSSGTKKTWEIYELLAENENIDKSSAKNIVKLFEDENTIPFICRYRRDLINNKITPEKLRNIKNSLNEIINLKKRAQNVIIQLQKDNILTNEIRNEILSAKTLEDLEFLYAPYKAANKGSLADRAKSFGLEKPAEHILYGKSPMLNIANLVDKSNPELDTREKVLQGICHIISHIISKSTEVLEELRKLQRLNHIVLNSKKAKPSSSSKGKENTKQQKNQKSDEFKYEHYFSFEISIKYIKPHQILAINRGEKSKYLTVKILIPDQLKYSIKYFVKNKFLSQGISYETRTEIFEKSFEECYSKKLQPLLTRQIRSELNEIAKKASIDVFAKNLKQLLLMSPLKGEKILGIDPGFSNGCKLALISENADVIETDVIYPHAKFGNAEESAEKLIKMLTRHNCNIIALGNGKGCRETEIWLTKLLEAGYLASNKIFYSIVSEQGASVYSCSDIGKKEFPNMDVNLISAISIARRLNDPLSEYVKVEPRHIGVGMYQHDINEKALAESLNEVVTECVSFVGVDVNTASLSILKYIAGLTTSKAEKIIEHRTKNGPFKTRTDLLKVKSIGEKTFTQCAGFIRIEPLSIGGSVNNLLDCTWVHPESYDIAEKIIKKCKLNNKKIGQSEFIEVIKEFASKASMDQLENEFKVPKERITIVLEALQRKLLQDYRTDIDKTPLFKQGITKMSELQKGSIVTGAVVNVTHFGAFVDIGVERDALIHTSKMNGMILNIGDRVQTIVLDVDLKKNHIQLKLEGLSI